MKRCKGSKRLSRITFRSCSKKRVPSKKKTLTSAKTSRARMRSSSSWRERIWPSTVSWRRCSSSCAHKRTRMPESAKWRTLSMSKLSSRSASRGSSRIAHRSCLKLRRNCKKLKLSQSSCYAVVKQRMNKLTVCRSRWRTCRAASRTSSSSTSLSVMIQLIRTWLTTSTKRHCASAVRCISSEKLPASTASPVRKFSWRLKVRRLWFALEVVS